MTISRYSTNSRGRIRFCYNSRNKRHFRVIHQMASQVTRTSWTGWLVSC